MSQAKLSKDLHRIVNEWSPEQRTEEMAKSNLLARILSLTGLDKPYSVAITAATGIEILTVTGVDVEKAMRLWHISKKYQWNLDGQNKSREIKPTPTFLEQIRRYDEFFDTGSEAMCRSRVDVFLAEALFHHGGASASASAGAGAEAAALKCYGEVEFSMSSFDKKLRLSGRGEYTIAWGDSSSARARNVSLIVEAKTMARGVSNRDDLIQVMTYMAIAHKERLTAKKVNPGVFGIITSSIEWVFLRIDNEGIPSRTKAYTVVGDLQEIVRHLAFVMAAAMSSSPTTSPVYSMDDLAMGGRLGGLSSIPNFTVAMPGAIPEETDVGNLADPMVVVRDDGEDEGGKS
ncbi:hypothetical protein HKX48_006925 [Thoreauomyces humboldtii]|nr:hypothetical protein HKX48_006925 [Thoreauomyces humboldtii]